MDNKFSPRVSEIIMYSKEEANRLLNSYIGPEHLLLGIIRQGNGKAMNMLLNLHLNPKDLKDSLENICRQSSEKEESYNNDIKFNSLASNILQLASCEADVLDSNVIDSEHLLLAFMDNDENSSYKIISSYGITRDMLLNEYYLLMSPKNSFGYGDDDFDYDDDDDDDADQNSDNDQNDYDSPGEQQTGKTTTVHGKSNNNTPLLDSFGIDLTEAARNSELDPVVGREKEIERVAQILSRRKKNNPVLIGQPGVGKSAIVEGLALRIVQKKVSRLLFNKRVISLDLTAMVAGTKYRGQFEERVRGILNEIKSNPDIILFIDEIHTIVGAGSAAGSMDAANMLKPSLARGEIQCVGATTIDEYRKSIEKDGALERRFQKVLVEPTNCEETLQILKNIKDKYEDHHNVTYTDEAIEACVKLTDRYVTDRSFPDKAIDALDEAGSRVHIGNITVPKEIEEQEKVVEELIRLKDKAVKTQNFELAASVRDKERACSLELDALKAKWEANLREKREIVDRPQIEEVVSMITGIPVQKMADDEGQKIKTLKNDLESKVIGQNKAIETLVKAIQRSRIGLKDPNRPIGTFLFLGPTGVGKTYLAKELATFMFGTSDSLIRMDMSEYMEKFAASRLVGAPPGYVGYEDGGQLTEKVRRKPYSIVLLDEIEKAHSDIFNILLQIMDEGRLTDSNGRTVDFKNTIIIMTSNVGSRQLKEFASGIGFSSQLAGSQDKHSREIITKALNKTFAPEFINRIDEIINFDQLDMDSLIKIIDIELKGLFERINGIGYQIGISDDAKKFLARKGYDVQFGARPLRRAIQSNLEDKISEVILDGKIKQGDTMNVVYSKEKDCIEIETESQK